MVVSLPDKHAGPTNGGSAARPELGWRTLDAEQTTELDEYACIPRWRELASLVNGGNHIIGS
jgi:hypothetical protein